ncbi:hypothetical protein ACFORO_23015 [Amycolatopsis halotolerans]|uniref:Uncharacterized protein n=1 Tax=Amycolatopsis halotolerans TaxID=330083 RepID=A0ABV7QI95_9PSEU
MARVYATAEDYANWLDLTTPPDGIARSLARASQLVDWLLVTAVYATDPAGYPTDPDKRAAVRDATCATVAWWEDTGDNTGAAARYTSTGIGSVTLSRANTPAAATPAGAQAARLAPEAMQLLADAGLGDGPVEQEVARWR